MIRSDKEKPYRGKRSIKQTEEGVVLKGSELGAGGAFDRSRPRARRSLTVLGIKNGENPKIAHGAESWGLALTPQTVPGRDRAGPQGCAPSRSPKSSKTATVLPCNLRSAE